MKGPSDSPEKSLFKVSASLSVEALSRVLATSGVQVAVIDGSSGTVHTLGSPLEAAQLLGLCLSEIRAKPLGLELTRDRAVVNGVPIERVALVKLNAAKTLEEQVKLLTQLKFSKAKIRQLLGISQYKMDKCSGNKKGYS